MLKHIKPLEKAFFLAVIFAAGLALALHLTGQSLSDVALGAKPPSPPGQGECSHGNSNKPCKDDPQPEHGKDCEEHGPKNGGVNEDHCKGTTPTETTPTETTPTETTPTTPTETTPTTEEPPTCNDCPSPTVPPTSPPTETTPTSPSPEEPGSSPGKPPVSAPGVSKPTLEEQLDKQAKANGAPPPSAPAAPTAAASTEELPYTGLPLWAYALLGAGLTGTGLALRRW